MYIRARKISLAVVPITTASIAFLAAILCIVTSITNRRTAHLELLPIEVYGMLVVVSLVLAIVSLVIVGLGIRSQKHQKLHLAAFILALVTLGGWGLFLLSPLLITS